MKIQHFASLLLTCVLLLASCSGGETAPDTTTDTPAETQTEETVSAEETEPEETEEAPKQQAGYTDYRKLTISEADAPYYDAASGLFIVRFTENNIRYHADDPCAIGISGDGEAYSVAGTIDMEAFPEFADGDYFTGVAVKPSEELYEGTYNITITFSSYMVSFPCTIG